MGPVYKHPFSVLTNKSIKNGNAQHSNNNTHKHAIITYDKYIC